MEDIINNLREKIKRSQISYNIKYIEKDKDDKKPYESDFISYNILKRINEEKYKFIIISTNNIEIRARIYDKDPNFSRFIQRVFWCENFLKTKKYDKIIIDYATINENKKLPETKGKILGKNDINNGYSMKYDNKAYIVIFRIEESLKVLVHEMIHIFEYDYLLNLNKELIDYQNSFPIEIKNNNINNRPAEAYTETLSEILNCIFVSIEKEEDAIKLIKREAEHSIKQVANILTYFDFKSFEEFYYSKSNRTLKQDTNVFNYYIINGALLFNLYEFLKFIEKDFYVSKNKMKDYKNLVLSSMNNKEFHKKINSYIGEKYNNLRMSVIE